VILISEQKSENSTLLCSLGFVMGLSLQLKELASKVTASAYKLSCSKPCTASVYDQEAAQAVQYRAAPAVVSEYTPRDVHSGEFSLPSPRYHYPINPLKEDESTASSCTAVLHGSSMADHKHHVSFCKSRNTLHCSHDCLMRFPSSSLPVWW
jgi:hypothetical protein